MKEFYAIVEVQVNDGIPAAAPVVIKNTLADAQGESWVKLGYAYQNPRDYTAVVIFDQDGYFPVESIVIDNREDKQPVYFAAEIQINDTDPVAIPVNVQVGENAKSLIMQVYHNALSYAWNVKRPYTLCCAENVFGDLMTCEVVNYLPPDSNYDQETCADAL